MVIVQTERSDGTLRENRENTAEKKKLPKFPWAPAIFCRLPANLKCRWSVKVTEFLSHMYSGQLCDFYVDFHLCLCSEWCRVCFLQSIINKRILSQINSQLFSLMTEEVTLWVSDDETDKGNRFEFIFVSIFHFSVYD